jgi:hypothetical protein
VANLVKWAAGGGVGLTYTTAFGTEINSLANGSVAVSTVVVANGTPLDVLADVSFSVTGTTASTGVNYLSFYLLPQNQDGTTYGDGVASGTTAPSTNPYFVGSVTLKNGVTAAALVGTLRGITLPPVSFKFAVVNNSGAALAASTNNIKYITYTENLNG